LTIEYARRRRPEILRNSWFEAGRAASRLGSVSRGTKFSFLKGALKSDEVRVDASADGSRRERPEHAC
jgi:hypothetical protein